MAPILAESGGVRSVVKFLVDNFQMHQDQYEIDLISLGASFQDTRSRRLLNPASWFRPVRIEKDQLWGLDLYRVGSNWTEIEFQRYKPRKVLDDLVEQYDVVQLVCGLPVWGNVAKNWKVPMCMQVATLTKLERSAGSASGGSWLISRWRKWMTSITSRLDNQGIQMAKAVMYENTVFGDWMDQHFPGIPKLFAPPGIDISIFQKSNAPGDNPIGEKYILNVGRLNDPRKDTPTLVRAYSRFIAKNPEEKILLVFAGKNNPVPELEKEIDQQGLAGRVRVMQDVAFDQLIQLYHHADFFVLSSKEEGLGIVVMEAMAAGLPVISTDCGGPSSLIDEGENGYFVPIGDDQTMADRIQKLVLDTDLRAKISANNLSTSKDFDNASRMRPYFKIYEELLQPDSGA